MKYRVYIPTIVLAVFLVGYYVYTQTESAPQTQQTATPVVNPLINQEAYVLPVLETTYFPLLNSSIPQPVVSAKSFLVLDTETERTLYSRSADQKLPVASLTKIMTAMVVLDSYNLNDMVTVASGSVKVDNERQDLYLGEQVSVIDLLQMMLIKSSNDAAYALAAHGQKSGIRLVEKMNEKAFQLGMANSLFFDPAGLEDDAYSTAQDLRKMMLYSFKNYNELWSITKIRNKAVTSADGKFKHDLVSTNKLFDTITGIEGGKTGYTDGALGCMILITKVPNEDSEIISIVLGSTNRFGDTKALVDWIFTAYRWK
jgi:D-alanyl-D-alanine carboxypeptidase (penicillin-binding protein 5/6)